MWLHLILLVTLLWPAYIFADINYLCAPSGKVTATVKTSKELTTALKNAKAGDTILLKGGPYKSKNLEPPKDNHPVEPTFKLAANGTEDQPITVKFDDGVTLQDAVFQLAGNYGRRVGGVWNNSQITILGDYNRVTRVHFTAGKEGFNHSALSGAVEIWGDASYNRVDHNHVDTWKRRTFRNRNVTNKTKGNIMDHNYYQAEVPKEYQKRPPKGNAGEVFQLGIGGKSPARGNTIGTIVEYNLVDGFYVDHEVVSIKALGVTIRYNTFLNAPMRVVDTRTSEGSKIIGNYLKDFNLGKSPSGIAIFGNDNQVVGNYLQNASIMIISGNSQLSFIQDKKWKKKIPHPTANNTAVVGNTVKDGSILLGDKSEGPDNKYYPKHLPVTNTCLYENSGNIKIVDKNAVKGTKTGSLCPGVTVVKASATPLTADQVGLTPKADVACQSATN